MSQHYQEVCEYGTVHGQCRCPNPTKTIRKIACPTPEKCQPEEVPPSPPRQYIDTPATVYDVVHEFTELARLTSMIQGYNPSATDRDREGWTQKQAVQQAKTALALESWMGGSLHEVVGMVVAHLEEPILERLATMHDKLHEPE